MNGSAAHDFIKISLLQGYITDENFDKICLSETFLNSSLNRDDGRLKVEVYNLISSDDTSDLKKEGVCIYYKQHIPLIRRNDLCSPSNCLVTEIRSENEKCSLTCLFRSTSQNQHEPENFCTNLDTLMDHINHELPTCPFLPEILMQDAQNGAIMILPMQMVVYSILLHHQQDMKKLSTSLLIL